MRERRALFVQYTNPAGYPPLEHAIGLLADRGWRVRVVGTGADGADVLALPEHPRVEVRRSARVQPGLAQKLDFVRFSLLATAEARSFEADLAYVSDPLAAPAGALIQALLPRCTVVYHEHDAPPPAQTRASSLVLAARARLLRRAPLCVVPGMGRAGLLREAGRPDHLSTLVVWNTPTRAEVIPRPEQEPAGPLRLHYHGTITPTRVPLAVVDAVARLDGAATLTVVGYETAGAPGHGRALRERASSLGVERLLEVLGPMSRAPLLECARRAQVGLALLSRRGRDRNLETLVGPSNKPFDYLACGLALLVPDEAGWRAAFVEQGVGVGCDPDDPTSIADAVRGLLERPAERLEMTRRGQALVTGAWSYETQFEPVLERLDELSRRRAHGS